MKEKLKKGACITRLTVVALGLTLAAALPVQAQMLLVEAGPDDPAQLRFNPEFIARNGVKSVSGQAWVKRDGRPMAPMDRHFLYRFGEAGRLEYANNSFGHPGSGLDTASVMYQYNAAGHLLQELHNDLNGFFALRREYDAEGRESQVRHVRLENLGTDRYRFVEGASTLVSEERFTYRTVNDTVRSRTWLNDRGRPYLEETFTSDGLGYLRQIARRNLITQQQGVITFTYDAKGRLSGRTEVPDLRKPRETTWHWLYDQAGNPLERDLLRDGALVRHSEFVYAEGTMFLKAVVTRNNETGQIDIVRYATQR